MACLIDRYLMGIKNNYFRISEIVNKGQLFTMNIVNIKELWILIHFIDTIKEDARLKCIVFISFISSHNLKLSETIKDCKRIHFL